MGQKGKAFQLFIGAPTPGGRDWMDRLRAAKGQPAQPARQPAAGAATRIVPSHGSVRRRTLVGQMNKCVHTLSPCAENNDGQLTRLSQSEKMPETRCPSDALWRLPKTAMTVSWSLGVWQTRDNNSTPSNIERLLCRVCLKWKYNDSGAERHLFCILAAADDGKATN